MPTRLSGSAAATSTISPLARRRRQARSASTASGSANCSPTNPSTKRPPRTSPRASRRRSAGNSVRHGGELRSRVQELAEQNAVAAEQHARLALGDFRGVGRDSTPSRSSAQRPTGMSRGERRRPGSARRWRRGWRFSSGSSRVRRPAMPSPVTSPEATSSHSASSTSLGRRRMPRAMSARKEAPRARRNSNACEAVAERSVGCSSALAGSSSTSRSSRSTKASGADRVGAARRRSRVGSAGSSVATGCASRSRPQATSPARQRSSRSVAS